MREERLMVHAKTDLRVAYYIPDPDEQRLRKMRGEGHQVATLYGWVRLLFSRESDRGRAVVRGHDR